MEWGGWVGDDRGVYWQDGGDVSLRLQAESKQALKCDRMHLHDTVNKKKHLAS